MSHGSRRIKSARTRTPSSTLPSQTLNLSIEDNNHDDPLPPPPRKERKHRQQNKDSAERTSTTVASGRTASAGHGDADKEEDETEEDDIPLAGCGRTKRNRPSSLHASPDVRKRARPRVSTSSTLAHTVDDIDSGDERDVSDLDLDAADSEDDEDDLLDIETRHLIDDFGNQSSEGESDNEDVVLSITKIPVDQLDGDTWFGFEPRRSHRAELENLLALADEPLEGGVISSIWYQDAGVGDDLDNIGNSESGSGGSASEPDTDEEADQLLLMRSWTSDTNEGSMSEGEDYGGDTTDSLDDGDELALIRFGIEVDEDAEHDPAPSVRSSETMVDMAAFAANPDAVINQTAVKLGVDRATAARILTGVGLSVIAQHDGDKKVVANKASSPKMGEFTATKPPETTIMVESGSAPVPSPFSARRSARLRHESSPSRRRNSVASHSSSLSLPSSGPKPSPSLSPAMETHEEPEGPAMDLDEVLHAAVLDPEGDAASSESEAVEDGTDQESTMGVDGGQFADLHRWDRVPIGAFRRSRANGSRSPLPDQGFHYLPVTAALFRGSPVLLPVQRIKGKTKGGLVKKKGKKLGLKQTPVKSTVAGKRAPSSLRKVAAQAAFLSSSPRPTRSKTGTPSFGGSPLFSTTGASTSAPIPPLHL